MNKKVNTLTPKGYFDQPQIILLSIRPTFENPKKYFITEVKKHDLQSTEESQNND